MPHRTDPDAPGALPTDWHAQELLLMREVMKLVGRSLAPAYVLREMLHLMSELLGLNRGRMVLANEVAEGGERTASVRHAYGLTAAEAARGVFRWGEGITGRVLASGLPAIVQDVDAEPLFLFRTVARADLPPQTVAFIALPIEVNGATVGVLACHRIRSRQRHLNDDLALLRILTTLAGQLLRLEQLVAEETRQLAARNEALERALDVGSARYGLIGRSPALLQALSELERVSESQATVLLLGESGTGKELFARAVHLASGRRDQPFIKVNCSAIPDTLFESELFGHERGAFTGAHSARPGWFEQAHGGTIFLDEIGELPLALQAKLLRTLQEGTLVRLGGQREIRVDVRLVAATHRDLAQELAAPPADLIAAVRAIAQGPLAEQAYAIDRGAYPVALMKRLAAAGAMSAHLPRADGSPGDYGQAILAMAEAAKVCGATGFMMWCQCVAGLYMQASGNPALTGERLARHVRGETLGGTGLSNPMKSFAQIESLLLKATPVDGGYLVNGALPWVSNLGPDHYFGTIAAVVDGSGQTVREMMFMLRCDAPGVTLKACPEFSGMEGTGTYSVQCKDLFVGPDDIAADPARPYIARIRGGFVLLQCGIAAGIVQGAIDSMWAVEDQLGHVNQFLEDRPAELQAEFDALVARILKLAETPFDTSTDYFIDVLDARAHGAELALRAANSALMHQGARGYLMSSEVQRRVREAQFVAIVTPAIKHLRKEIARLSTEVMPA